MSYLTTKPLKRVTLPSDGAYWVDLSTDFTYGDIKGIGSNLEGTEASDKFLSLAIKEWNLDDEAGTVLLITQTNIDLLKKDDVLAIIAALNVERGVTSEKKDLLN